MNFPAATSLLIRLDYTDDRAWIETLHATRQPDSGSDHHDALTIVDDPELHGMPVDELLEHLAAAPNPYAYVFVADEQTIIGSEHSILALALPRGDRDAFGLRIAPSQIAAVEANLATGNLDLDEFAASTDADGVYRGILHATTVPVPVARILTAIADSPRNPVLDKFRAALEQNPGPREYETVPVDMRKLYEQNSRRPTSFFEKNWDVLGRDEYLDTLSGGGRGLGLTVPLPGGSRWDVVLDPVTVRPLCVVRWSKRPPRSVGTR